MRHTMSRRRFIQGAAVTGAAALAPTSALGQGRRTRRAADLVVHNGNVLTMTRRFETAEAVAIRNGEVIATGPM
jgi:hypothetical protein